MPSFDLNAIRFIPHPDLAGTTEFITVEAVLDRVVEGYRDSLFSFEWLDAQGRVKNLDEMKEAPRAEREWAESVLAAGRPLAQPILGIGLAGNIEIGAERAVLLTLAAHGLQSLPVHIPAVQEDEFKAFMRSAPRTPESGNVLLYILIVIVVLAALSFTVSQSGRNGGAPMLTDAQASTAATEVLTYANHVKTAAAKLKLRGCADAELNFDNTVVAGYTNGGAPADDSCDFFSSAGGALTWVTPASGLNNGSPWFYTGAAVVHNDHGVYSTNVAGNADLVMVLFDLPQNLCTKINAKLGVTGVPVDDGVYASVAKFTGTYTAAEDINGLPEAGQPSPCSSPSTGTNFCGRETGCFREEGGGQRYIFFQVLLKRSA